MSVYSYYAWRDQGIFAQLNYNLTGLARAKDGRDPEPTAAAIDTQTVKTSTNSPTDTQGVDAAKKIVGRNAMIDSTSKRITGETTPTWRGTY